MVCSTCFGCAAKISLETGEAEAEVYLGHLFCESFPINLFGFAYAEIPTYKM
jgi:hypothetical protein